MASATLNIQVTITDTPTHSLAMIRDGLLISWNYLGGGGIGWPPLGTAQDKLNFIQAMLAKSCIENIKGSYLQKLEKDLRSSDLDVQ